MRDTRPWRLLLEGPSGAAWNMAVDESLLDAYAAEDPPRPPTLRLYGWQSPTLSIGRSQPAAGGVEPGLLGSENIGLVRRPTGGFAVLHDRERTYAVAARIPTEELSGGVLEAYRRIAEALRAAFRRLGLDPMMVPRAVPQRRRSVFCLEQPAPYELEVGGAKLVGSAQRRRRRGLLQHGSIFLELDAGRLGRLARSEGGLRRPLLGLQDVLGRPLDPAELDEAIVAGFEEAFGARLVPGGLSPEEVGRARLLERLKYGTRCWTLEGRLAEDAEKAGLVA